MWRSKVTQKNAVQVLAPLETLCLFHLRIDAVRLKRITGGAFEIGDGFVEFRLGAKLGAARCRQCRLALKNAINVRLARIQLIWRSISTG